VEALKRVRCRADRQVVTYNEIFIFRFANGPTS